MSSYLDAYYTAFSSLSAILAFVITFLNLLLVVAILTSRKLRQSLRHVTIASLTVADVIIGLIVCPFNFLENVVFPDECLQVISMHARIFASFVSCWGLVFLHVYYLLAVLDVRPRGLSDRASAAALALGSLAPWILALIVVPSFVNLTFRGEYPCLLSLRTDFRVFAGVSTWLPLCIVLVLSVVNVIYHRSRRQTGEDSTAAQLIRTAKSGVESPAALVAVSLVTAAMVLPLHIFNVTHTDIFSVNFTIIITTIMSLSLVLNAKSAAVPLVWMADAGIRTRMLEAICCRCHQDDEDVMHSEIGYKSIEQKHDVSMDKEVQP